MTMYLLKVDIVQKEGVITGKLYSLLRECDIYRFTALLKLVLYEVSEMDLVLFGSNVFLDGFEKVAIHL